MSAYTRFKKRNMASTKDTIEEKIFDKIFRTNTNVVEQPTDINTLIDELDATYEPKQSQGKIREESKNDRIAIQKHTLESVFGSFLVDKKRIKVSQKNIDSATTNLIGGFGNLDLLPPYLDTDEVYDLPSNILTLIHNFLVEELLPTGSPKFSTIYQLDGADILEPLYSFSIRKQDNFINDCNHHNLYTSRIIHLIVRDYPIMEPTVLRIKKIRYIMDCMSINCTNSSLKDNVNFYKVYFKSMCHFYYKPNTKPSSVPNAYLDVMIERKTNSKYMLIPYSKHAWGKKGQNRLVFYYFEKGKINQHIIDPFEKDENNVDVISDGGLIAQWGSFLKDHLREGTRVFLSDYGNEKNIFRTFLDLNYRKNVEIISTDSNGFGLSPLHHIKKIEVNAMKYNQRKLLVSALSCWDGVYMSIPELYSETLMSR